MSAKPTDIKLLQKSRLLEVSFDSGETFQYSCEFLRVYSQSAEVTGHGPGQETLQLDKQDVNIDNISPVGNYAIKLHFDDGHDTGIYTWQRLYDLGKNKQSYWMDYLRRVMRAGHSHPELEKLKQQQRPKNVE
ncbi:gamma-butyrobetaine hydroxylase-like domain-containing protein [Thiomicrorhabdus sediminis]|uniref:DUF971 domain-containing protein n=1 Tax=Thiomicrorhabdus sediminis TaxID=2580412 RepID=A0A4P9K3P9_9GAMM|nr:DUF971 domain-containing protein [Thiomicrorhabdus sediminis]QCU89522.1 DUF971 domain-containing protein [Thiomicrorhabdus sediminis]